MTGTDLFRGTGVAMITPFQEDGEIDFDRLIIHANSLIEQGINYLVVLGTTAETPTLSSREKENVIREASILLEDPFEYKRMIADHNPYGDGHASKRIVRAVKYYFGVGERPEDFSSHRPTQTHTDILSGRRGRTKPVITP